MNDMKEKIYIWYLVSYVRILFYFCASDTMSEIQRRVFRICPKIPIRRPLKTIPHPRTVPIWPFKLMVFYATFSEYLSVIFVPADDNINEMKAKVQQHYQKLGQLKNK